LLLSKSAGDVSVTVAEEKVELIGSKESALSVQVDSAPPQTSMRSVSARPLEATPLPSSTHKPLKHAAVRRPRADISVARFAGQAWFQKYFADAVCTHIYIFQSVNTTDTL